MLGAFLALLNTPEEKTRFEHLYLENRSIMYNYAMEILKDSQLAEDKKRNIDSTLRTEIVSILNNASDRTMKCIDGALEKRILEISKFVPTIDEINNMTLDSINALFKESLKSNSFEVDGITDLDIKSICEIFTYELKKQLSQNDVTCKYLLLNSVDTNNKKVEHLEKQVLSIVNNRFMDDECRITDDLQYYYQRFIDPLFIHKNYELSKRISLQDLYIIPYANQIEQSMISYKANDSDTIIDLIQKFLNLSTESEIDVDIMLINGLPAVGKSSLISKLAFDYRTNNTELFNNNRKAVIIRLRNMLIKIKTVNVENPFSDFIFYLCKTNVSELQELETKNIEKKTV